jgi:hypothetical protein
MLFNFYFAESQVLVTNLHLDDLIDRATDGGRDLVSGTREQRLATTHVLILFFTVLTTPSLAM